MTSIARTNNRLPSASPVFRANGYKGRNIAKRKAEVWNTVPVGKDKNQLVSSTEATSCADFRSAYCPEAVDSQFDAK